MTRARITGDQAPLPPPAVAARSCASSSGHRRTELAGQWRWVLALDRVDVVTAQSRSTSLMHYSAAFVQAPVDWIDAGKAGPDWPQPRAQLLTGWPAPEHDVILAVGPHDRSALDIYQLLLAAADGRCPGRGADQATVLRPTA
jgi:hypothetical protein